MRGFSIAAILLGLLVPGSQDVLADSPSDSASGRVKPSAVATLDDGRHLFVSSRENGSVAVVDAPAERVVRVAPVGLGLSAIVPLPDHRHLLALDEAGGRLILLAWENETLRVVSSMGIAAGPVDLVVSKDGKRGAAASKWPRLVTFFEVDPAGALKATTSIELPFNPRRQIWVDRANRLIVADAFGGRLALIDVLTAKILSIRSVQAHNIGGLALSADGLEVLMTQQYLNARSATGEDDIHWGFLMTNSVRSLKLSSVLDPDGDLIPGGSLNHLGEPGHGAGDPSGLLALADGTVVTALSGVDEVAIGTERRPDQFRRAVGQRPTALLALDAGKRVAVVNTFDDSLSIIDVATHHLDATIPLGPKREPSLAETGERLFHNAKLSHEGWMSCQSCHTDGHASQVKADTLGDGSYGAPKRKLSLLGIADTAPYAWDGKIATLEEQVHKSFLTTLRGKAATDGQAKAVTAYLQSLASPPPVGNSADPAAAERGARVFTREKCDRCHAPPNYTSAKSYDVGLDDEMGNRFFNPPSLRSVSQRDALFHDGRAKGLEQVFTRYGHPGDRDWREADVADLTAFLRGL